MLDAVAGLISLATKRAFNCRRQLKLGDLLRSFYTGKGYQVFGDV